MTMKDTNIKKLLNTIIIQDCIEGMKGLPDKSVDLVIADPPYNLSKGNNWKWDNSVVLKGMGGNWNKVMENWDNMDLQDYWLFSMLWINEVKRVLKPSGSLWVYGTYHNIGILNVIFQILKIEILNEEIVKKDKEFNFLVEIPSNLGRLKYFVKVRNKKKINEGDLSLEYNEAQAKSLPLLFLTNGDIAKKAKEHLDKNLSGIVFKKF